jgi:hypothetical protein
MAGVCADQGGQQDDRYQRATDQDLNQNAIHRFCRVSSGGDAHKGRREEFLYLSPNRHASVAFVTDAWREAAIVPFPNVFPTATRGA